ncbi:MAG: MarR family winged helix-turn-helix transcriptional regulator, partial [Streptosporangiaceae bacterium]
HDGPEASVVAVRRGGGDGGVVTQPRRDSGQPLNRYAAAAVDGDGQHTLAETESAVAERLRGLSVDVPAMAAVSNIYRAAGAVRNNFERTVLQPYDLTWTAWVVLWVVWIWQEIETRHVAAEAGISKGTLTGVAATLQRRGLLARRVHPGDGRRVLLTLTDQGSELMDNLFPEFNRAEQFVTATLGDDEKLALAQSLRAIVRHLEQGPPSPASTAVPARPAR